MEQILNSIAIILLSMSILIISKVLSEMCRRIEKLENDNMPSEANYDVYKKND